MAPDRSGVDLGSRLRAARERRGVSLRQIAGATKISVSALEALERKRFESHCSKVYPFVAAMASDLAPELALIPAGEFLMGSEDAEEDERPLHRVHIDDFFLILVKRPQ